MYKLLAVAVLAVGVGVILFVMGLIRRHGFRVVFYPPVFLLIFYATYFLMPSVPALWFEDTLVYRYVVDGYSFGSWLGAQVYAFVFMLVAAGSSALFLRISTFKKYQQLAVSDPWRRMTVSGRTLYVFLLYLLPAASMVFVISKVGGVGYEDYMLDRIASRKGLGYVIMPSLWFAITISVLYFNNLVVRKNLYFLPVLVLLLVAYVAAHLYLGSKSRGLIVIAYGLLVFLFYRAAMQDVGLQKLLVSAALIIGISFVGLRFGDIREAVTKGVSVEAVNTRADKSMLFSKFNAFGAIENTVWLVENMRPAEVSYGGNFVSIVVGPIPRAIWPNKPVGGGPYLRNMISPGSYDIVSGSRLTSYSPGIIAESYMAFWAFGIFIIGPLFGLALALFGRLLRRVRSSLALVVWVICLMKLAYILTGEVFSTISSIGQTALPVLLLLVASRIFSFKVYRDAN